MTVNAAYDHSVPRVLVIQHDEDKPLGRLEEPLQAAGLDLDIKLAGHEPVALSDDHAALIGLPGFANPVDETEAVIDSRAAFRVALDRGLPALGICLGGQLLAQAAGAAAGRCDAEYGYAPIELTDSARADRLLGRLPPEFEVFHAHDYAVSLPEGAAPLARTSSSLQAFSLGPAAWGIQFHPEPTVEIIDEWVARHANVLRTRGVDPAKVALDARRLDSSAGEVASRIAGGFARSVLERSERRSG